MPLGNEYPDSVVFVCAERGEENVPIGSATLVAWRDADGLYWRYAVTARHVIELGEPTSLRLRGSDATPVEVPVREWISHPTADVAVAPCEWYEKDKAPNIDDEQARVLRTIIDKVIAERRARSFLLEKEYEKDPLILSLFDFRLLHLVQRGYADKDRPGVRYNIYTLDYGTYVDLIGTQKAPTGDFTEELEGDESETVVPFDDRRSIRRIILRPEQLQGNGAVEGSNGAGSAGPT